MPLPPSSTQSTNRLETPQDGLVPASTNCVLASSRSSGDDKLLATPGTLPTMFLFDPVPPSDKYVPAPLNTFPMMLYASLPPDWISIPA